MRVSGFTINWVQMVRDVGGESADVDVQKEFERNCEVVKASELRKLKISDGYVAKLFVIINRNVTFVETRKHKRGVEKKFGSDREARVDPNEKESVGVSGENEFMRIQRGVSTGGDGAAADSSKQDKCDCGPPCTCIEYRREGDKAIGSNECEKEVMCDADMHPDSRFLWWGFVV